MAFLSSTSAFSSSRPNRISSSTSLYGATTIDAPTKEKTGTDRDTQKRNYDDDDFANMEDKNVYDDLEYLIDPYESREMEDPFHILLMGSTFEKPKITVPYVAGSLEYVLNMPFGEGEELSQFAKDQGMSCLGTWPREECLTFGKQLQMRDIVCRVVPFCEGGQRGWQAKDTTGSSSNNADNYAQ